ncbi:MAG: hypothetical protein LUB83_06000 [Prevotellaceae bacterium]|nr:hypothetical protein [Prevotellaceae bacterium]
MEKRSVPFDLQCREVNGKWGIFVQIGEHLLRVKGIFDLINSVFENKHITLYLPDETEEVPCHVDCVLFQKRAYQWTLQSESRPQLFHSSYFKLSAYQESIKKAVTDYMEVCRNDKPIHQDEAYDKEWLIETLPLGVRQLNVKATLPSYDTLTTGDIQIENFVFDPEAWGYYTIGIGDRTYYEGLDILGNDMEATRHGLESIVYEDEAVIRLSNDDCIDTLTVTFKKETVSKSGDWKEDSCSCPVDNTHYMRVEIRSDSTDKPLILTGYCDPKQATRCFYEGLLRLTLKQYPQEDTFLRYDFYNMFKSPLLEDYLVDKKREPHVPQTRQREVGEVITFGPDYNVLGYYELDYGNIYPEENDVVRMDDEDWTLTLQGVSDWMRDSQRIDAARREEKEISSMELNQFHERGMALARELKRLVPADYDVWYVSYLDEIWTLVI